MDQRRRARGGIGRGDVADDARERGLVDSQRAGGGGPPAVAGLGRRGIDVGRRPRRAREEARRAGRRDPGQLDLAAEIVPAQAQPIGIAEPSRAMIDLAALVAQVEADRIAVAGDEEAGGASIGVERGRC
jgi:hypothetical protein